MAEWAVLGEHTAVSDRDLETQHLDSHIPDGDREKQRCGTLFSGSNGKIFSDGGTFELRHSFFSRGEKEGRKEVEKCGV